MGESPRTGGLPLWIRSTNLREQCMMKIVLDALYERDADAGYFLTGTGLHMAFEAGVTGATPEEMYELAAEYVAEGIAGADEVRWTKRRPEEDWPEMVQTSIERFLADVVTPESRLEVYDRCEFIEVEYMTSTDSGRTAVPPVQTEVDAIVRMTDGTGRYGIIDWKTGSTAKADSGQLWLYNYGLRHTPGSPLEGVPADQVDMWFHHVWHGKIQVADPYPGDAYMEQWLAEYASRMRRVSATGFASCTPEWYCNYCLVQSKCPLYGGDLEAIMRDARSAPLEPIRPEEG